MWNDLPWLGKVEHNTIEIGFVDSVVGAPELHVVALERLGAKNLRHVLLGSLSEVFAKLVTGDLGTGAQHSHRQCARPNTAFEYPRTREYVGDHQDRAEVLRIDHLGATGHLQDELRQRWADHQVATTAGRLDVATFRLANHVVVADEASVGVKFFTHLKGHRVTAVLDVNKLHDFACGEVPGHVSSMSGRATISTGTATRSRLASYSGATRSTNLQNAHTSLLDG